MAPRVEDGSAARRAYQWVRTRVLDGTFPAGTMVTEGEVADAVSVSRTPVREAFLQLAAEEVLELYPKRGALVASVSATQLREVLTARLVIEPWAGAVVARRKDRSQTVKALREFTAEALAALAHDDDRAFREADREFHQCLMSAAGNHLIATFYTSLQDRQARGGSLAVRTDPQRAEQSMAQHTAIADAIERGDAAGAAEAVRAHINDTTRALGFIPQEG